MLPRSLRLSGSLISQAALLAAVFLALGYLASTAAQNLRDLGIASGFGFLEQESGFVIGETTLISHSPGDTYLRALVVGIFNTARVAFLAILLSTLIGIMLGLARLSENWLVAKFAAGYVEMFRNTPLIVQLFFWYAVLTENLPGPADAWSPLPGIYVSNRGMALPWPQDLGPAGLLLGTMAILACAALLTRWVRSQFARTAAFASIVLPALAYIFLVHWEVPRLSGFNFTGGAAFSPEFTALLLGLSLYTAAFIAEIVRAGFLSVERGQIESGFALALSRRQVLRLIVAPQALRSAVPPVTSQYLNCVKNSSLAVAIGYPDLVSITNTTINQTGQAIEGFAILMSAYLTVSLGIAALMNYYNRRIALRGLGE